MKLLLTVVLLGIAGTCHGERNPRLFFATISSSTSTSTMTTTISTTSICFTTSGSVSKCTSGRRKRLANYVDDAEEFFAPTKVRGSQLLSSEEETAKAPKKAYRDARLFLLATSTSTITATATSTTSKYTATLSLTLDCSPSNISFCG